mgnify:CR=1 FL=1
MKSTRREWVFVALLALGLPVQAMEPAAKEPIYIESDSLKIDDTKGVSIYEGSVVFRQGPDTLRADRLVIHSSERKEVDKIVATGAPARFDHEAVGPDEEDSWGEAETIEYHAGESLLVLNGSARFRQGENQFSGNRIEYESDKRLVRAGKSVAGEGRVQIVIHPRSDVRDESGAEPAQESPQQ